MIRSGPPGWLKIISPSQGFKISVLNHLFQIPFATVLGFSRESDLLVCSCVHVYAHTHTHRFILKNQELGHRIVRNGKSEICRIGQQAGNQGKNWSYTLNPKALWRQNSIFLRGKPSIILSFKTSNDYKAN